MKNKIIVLAIFALPFLAGCATSEKNFSATPPPIKPPESGYAPVNGIKMYYEVHGPATEVPLVLLHGGGSTIDSAFSKFLPLISKNRRVIAIEEQGHGRTEGREGPVSFTQTADDMAEVLKYLKIQRADVFGFSNGASSSLQLAIRHPEVVRKLVFASSFTKRSGAIEGFWNNFRTTKKCMMPDVLRQAFLKVNPSEDLAEKMCQKDLARITNFIETPDKDVKKVTAPTLILMGDRDIVTVNHGRELTKLLTKGRLAVMLGDHGSYLGDISASPSDPQIIQATALLVDSFLNAN
jgi:pimeloyl-ACP methyl ester carboxylesterase